jgi:hypothetical protein
MDLERNGQYSDSESVASDCSSNDEGKGLTRDFYHLKPLNYED